MESLKELEEHDLWKILLEHVNTYFKDMPNEIYEIESSYDVDEHQFYIRNVGFTYIHLKNWIEQLFLSKELIRNYEYNSKSSYNRFDHFFYNYENYIIRYQSTKDRIMQLINAIFHLCISDNNVNEKNILSNLKVKHAGIDKRLKEMKTLKIHEQIRNEIIHRNSLLDKQLRKLEIFYSNKNPNNEFKKYRSERLAEEIKKTIAIISKQNSSLLKEVLSLLDLLINIYTKIELELR